MQKEVTDKRILGYIARLLEFYSKEQVNGLFYNIDTPGCDLRKAFTYIDSKLMESLATKRIIPSIDLLRELYLNI